MSTYTTPAGMDPRTYLEELWSETFGSGWEYTENDIRVKYEGIAAWDVMGVADVAIHDGDKWQRKSVTAMDIAEALEALKAQGYGHCGTGIDLGNFDACVSFDLLQQAVLGELIFG